MDERLERFRAEAAHVGARRAGRKFPKDLIALGGEYARVRRDAGDSWQVIAGELGVGVLTVRRWSENVASPVASFKRVRVVERASGSYAAVVGGLRIEGLELDAVIALARALS